MQKYNLLAKQCFITRAVQGGLHLLLLAVALPQTPDRVAAFLRSIEMKVGE